MPSQTPDADRKNQLDQLNDETWDVLVIGGGVVGSGVARDAAMRGLRVLLVDRYDFSFGTSSRSTRMIHGGLRYLSQGRVRLVRESSREKCTLHKIAPHICEPLPFVFPAFRGEGWPKWQLRIGVKIYDWLCGGKNLGRSSVLSTQDTVARLPGLRQDGLRGSVRYFDGFSNDARLVIDTLRSAAVAGATLLNYVRFVDAQRDGETWNCTLQDELGDRRIDIRAGAVVNATGPWSDKLPHSKTRLRPTKGVHLVIEHSRLPVLDAVFVTEGKRILFAIPWGTRTLIGSTDTDYDGPIEAPTCDDDDIQYVLDIINRSFPSAGLVPSDVISTWSGLRPLVAGKGGGPSDISREHEINMPEPGWYDVTGGKLTIYRLMGEQTVDRIVRQLGRECPPCRTAEEPLLTDPAVAAISRILPPDVTEDVVREFCLNEWVVHLDDLMVRRTSWRYYRTDHVEIAERAASWMAGLLGWDAERIEAEMSRYTDICAADIRRRRSS